MSLYPDPNLNIHRLISFSGRRLFVIICLGLITVSFSSYAQVYPRQYLEQAMENNPGLKARYMAFEVALEQPEIAGALPSPELTAGIFTPPMNRLMGRQLFDVGLMQMFPWFGTLGKRKEAAGKLADANYQQYRNERNSLYFEITRQWLEVYKTEQQISILSRFIVILEEREDLVYSRYQGGMQSGGVALDIYRLEMQLNELKNRYSNLEETLRTQMRQFNIILNREADSQVETPDTLLALDDFPGDVFPDTADFNENPMVGMTRAQAQAAAFEQELSQLNTRPMLGVGVQYSHFAPGEAAMGQMDGGVMVMPMFSITIPIYGKKNNAMRNQGDIRARMALFQEEEQINDLASSWAEVAASQNTLMRDQEFLIQQLDLNRRTWELVLVSYSGGQEGFDELLQIQDQLLDLEWRLLETIVQQHVAASRMDMLLAKGVFE